MNDKSIPLIIKELKELSDLLQIVDSCQTEVPGMLYDLIEKKAGEIDLNIRAIRKFTRSNSVLELEEETTHFLQTEAEPETEREPESTTEERAVEDNAPNEIVESRTEELTFPTVVVAEETITEIQNEKSEKAEWEDPVEIEATEPVEIVENESFFKRKADIFDLLSVPAKKEQEPETPPNQSESKKTAETVFETVGSTTLDDVLQRKLITDIRKAISLNDRFRFKRELFANDDQLMSRTLDVLNNTACYTEALNVIKEKFNWEEENSTVADFLSIVEKRFAQ